MFALEVLFHDGISPNEMIFVRRSHAILGNSEFAHVVIEGAAQELTEVRLSRGLGREFYCHPLSRAGQTASRVSFVEGVYSSGAELDLGGVTARITSLDADLHVLPDEPPDQAGARILRRALTMRTPVFPAVAVLGSVPLFVSFAAEQPVRIGRSRACQLRLDAADVSSEHARIGFEQGRFWVEDLGSTNGTFVNSAGGERVQGRRFLHRDERVILGSEILLAGVVSMEDVAQLSFKQPHDDHTFVAKRSYPALVGDSELIKPQRLPLTTEKLLSLGRDPASDIWVAAAHISRKHAEIKLLESGDLEVIDVSSNGIFADGERLDKFTPVVFHKPFCLLDLNGGIRIAFCASEEEEDRFLQGGTASHPPRKAAPAPPAPTPLRPESVPEPHGPPHAANTALGTEETIRASQASLLAERSLGGASSLRDDGAASPDVTSRMPYDIRPPRSVDTRFGGYELSEESEPQLSRLGSLVFFLALIVLTVALAVLLIF